MNIKSNDVHPQCSTFGSRVAKWFDDRKITQNATLEAQLTKLSEEFSELEISIEDLNNPHCDQEDVEIEFRDAIGDMAVVLAGLAHMKGYTFEQCCEQAWNEIKNRTGHLSKNGIFIKDE